MLHARLPVAANAEHAGQGPYPREVRDEDVSQLQEWLQHCGIPRVGPDIVHQAVDQRAHERSYHPLRNWLDSLKGKHDGKSRVGTWLTDYLGADPTENGRPTPMLNENTGEPILDKDGKLVMDESDETVTANGIEYLKFIGRMWLIAMVARVCRPGCKQDYMPVMEGDQSEFKSGVGKILADEKYFSDNLPDINRKDAEQHLAGKWLIEVAELHVYSRAQTDGFKAFLSRDTERYRRPYGREDVHEPRTCICIGTTNKGQYLQDETGNRRFLPFKTSEIKLDDLRRDREQLFAEAVKLYHEGVKWWPDRDFEKKYLAPQQKERVEPDVFTKPIAEYLDTLDEPKPGSPRTTTIIEVAVNALGCDHPSTTKAGGRGTPINRLGTRDQRRIRGVLTLFGYKPRHTEKGNIWELHG